MTEDKKNLLKPGVDTFYSSLAKKRSTLLVGMSLLCLLFAGAGYVTYQKLGGTDLSSQSPNAAPEFIRISLPPLSTPLEFTYSNYDEVKTLEVEGHLSDGRLAKLFSLMPNLQTLTLKLTSTFKFGNARRVSYLDHANLKELILIEESVGENREGLFDYLDRANVNLKTIQFHNIVAVLENSPQIRNFLHQNRMTLERLYFMNVTFARNSNVFDGLYLDKLSIAVVDINQEHLHVIPVEFLDDVSKASPNLREFSSNARCSKGQRVSALRNWKHLTNRMICDFSPRYGYDKVKYSQSV